MRGLLDTFSWGIFFGLSITWVYFIARVSVKDIQRRVKGGCESWWERIVSAIGFGLLMSVANLVLFLEVEGGMEMIGRFLAGCVFFSFVVDYYYRKTAKPKSL